MAKICTTIKQSKKLIELGLDTKTADMYLWEYEGSIFLGSIDDGDYRASIDTLAWSLSALLGLLPKRGAKEPMVQKLYYASEPKERYVCKYSITDMTGEYDNPIDACYEMICWLLKNKKL